jgi:hypothetical protein
MTLYLFDGRIATGVERFSAHAALKPPFRLDAVTLPKENGVNFHHVVSR